MIDIRTLQDGSYAIWHNHFYKIAPYSIIVNQNHAVWHDLPGVISYRFGMDDEVALFWSNVNREIKQQNITHEWVAKKAGISLGTFQGWIAKGIFPRLNEALRIAAVLNVSVEYLTSGKIQDNGEAMAAISRELAQAYTHLDAISKTLQESWKKPRPPLIKG
jgi:transcriptional regulator with XRE-family HTH domain